MFKHINKSYYLIKSSMSLLTNTLNKSYTTLGYMMTRQGSQQMSINELKKFISEEEFFEIKNTIKREPLLRNAYQQQKLMIDVGGFDEFHRIFFPHKNKSEFEEKIGYNTSFGLIILEMLNNIVNSYNHNYINSFNNDLCKAWINSITAHENFVAIVLHTIPVISSHDNYYYRNDSFFHWSKKINICPRLFDIDHLVKPPFSSKFKVMPPILSNIVHESAHAYDYLNYDYKSGKIIENILADITDVKSKQQQYKCLASFFDPMLLKTYKAFVDDKPYPAVMVEPIAFYMERILTINNEKDTYTVFQSNFSDYIRAKIKYLKREFTHEQILISISIMKKFTMINKAISLYLSDEHKNTFQFINEALNQEIKIFKDELNIELTEKIEQILFNDELIADDIPVIEIYSQFSDECSKL